MTPHQPRPTGWERRGSAGDRRSQRSTRHERVPEETGKAKFRLRFDMLRQPDDMTCGPTCLHAVYRYYGLERDLHAIIRETRKLDEGGTLAVMLACHALRSGFRATIYTFNINVFDPTWFRGEVDLAAKLEAQRKAKSSPKIRLVCSSYLEFLELGGRIRFCDLTTTLIRKHLKARIPILTGLSATYLYQTAREAPPDDRPDDVLGVPAGHFVVLCGYDAKQRDVLLADPLHPNPLAKSHYYRMDINRVICSILLGVVTDDANLLILEPGDGTKGKEPGRSPAE